MFGAIAGDIIGSPYRDEKPDADFPILTENSRVTEITVMTLAVAEALMRTMRKPGVKFTDERFRHEVIYWMKAFGKKSKKISFGRKFQRWLNSPRPRAYGTSSNGAALRVSPIAWAFDNLEDVEKYAEIAAGVTHNTDDGIKYARTVAGMVFLARMKKDKDDIKTYFEEKTGLTLSKTIEEIRPGFEFKTSCPETVPAAVTAFLEGNDFEEAVRKAVSLGGETNATASMAGAIAEALLGIKILIESRAFEILDRRLKFYVEKWEQWKPINLPACSAD